MTCILDDQQRSRRSLRLRQDRRSRSGRLPYRRATWFPLGKTGALHLLQIDQKKKVKFVIRKIGFNRSVIVFNYLYGIW